MFREFDFVGPAGGIAVDTIGRKLFFQVLGTVGI